MICNFLKIKNIKIHKKINCFILYSGKILKIKLANIVYLNFGIINGINNYNNNKNNFKI